MRSLTHPPSTLARAAHRSTTRPKERQLTRRAWNHELDNNDNFSPDSKWIVCDTREPKGGIGGNARIVRTHVKTGETQVLYRERRASGWGPGVGAANVNPVNGSVSFIRGLDSANRSRPYAAWRRCGVLIHPERPGLTYLDARDVKTPYTAGALRGGTHRHEWSADGAWIGFTYEDAVVRPTKNGRGLTSRLRTIGVAMDSGAPVRVPSGPQNHDGTLTAAIVVQVVPVPKPGSDEISRAFEDAWVGRCGYLRRDGNWQVRARAFLGTVRTKDNRDLTEVYIVDIPDRIDLPGASSLQGTAGTLPAPPKGTVQRRLTFTEDRKFPGVALAPRHWVRSSPDGTRIVFLAKDGLGVIQAYFVAPHGGQILQATRLTSDIQSCVRWSPDGRFLLFVSDGSIMISHATPGTDEFARSQILTEPSNPAPESPVWSPDGRRIAFNRCVPTRGTLRKQIFQIDL